MQLSAEKKKHRAEEKQPNNWRPFQQGCNDVKCDVWTVGNFPVHKGFVAILIMHDGVGDSFHILTCRDQKTEMPLQWGSHETDYAPDAVLHNWLPVGEGHRDLAIVDFESGHVKKVTSPNYEHCNKCCQNSCAPIPSPRRPIPSVWFEDQNQDER